MVFWKDAEANKLVTDQVVTVDQTTALFYDAYIAANTSVELQTFIPLATTNGTIGVRTSTASALTFTAFGAEIT